MNDQQHAVRFWFRTFLGLLLCVTFALGFAVGRHQERQTASRECCLAQAAYFRLQVELLEHPRVFAGPSVYTPAEPEELPPPSSPPCDPPPEPEPLPTAPCPATKPAAKQTSASRATRPNLTAGLAPRCAKHRLAARSCTRPALFGRRLRRPCK